MNGAKVAARRAYEAAKFLRGVYAQRVVAAYWARVRGDLFSRLIYPGDHTDPYEIYQLMRARGPLLRTHLGNYTTTSHRLCNEVLRNRTFGVKPADDFKDVVHNEVLDLSLLELNPPDHTRIRRLAAPAFTPRRMARYADLVDEAIARLLDRAAEMSRRDGSVDLMSAFASPLPIAVMTHLLGLPDDPDKLRRLGSTVAGALDGIWSLGQARALAAADAELRDTFADLLRRREAERSAAVAGGPVAADDLVSALVAEQGISITPDELAPLIRLLLVAGFETTVNAIGNGMRWLLADRRQWELLVADPSRAAAAAEEVLRFDPPVQQTARVANDDIELGGTLIKRNQWVITLLAAANRDPQVYPDAQRLDIMRDRPAEHLAFSGGIHYCLGSPLARMELARALAALATRFPDLQPVGPVEMRRGTTLRGPLRLPVALGRPARVAA